MKEGGIIHKYLLTNNVDKWEQVTSNEPEKLPTPASGAPVAAEAASEEKKEVKDEEKDREQKETEKELKEELNETAEPTEEPTEEQKEEEEDVVMAERKGDDWAHTAMRHQSLEEEFALEKGRRARREGGWQEGGPEPELVYLTGDAREELQELSKDEIYIIGGLLDHNSLKFASLNRAKEKNIRTARLPIGAFIEMESRHVLAINHVFEIILAYLENGGDWEQAFLSVMPKRKAAKKKGQAEEDEAGPAAAATAELSPAAPPAPQ